MQLFDNPRKFKNILRELSQNFSLENNEIIETLERALVSAYKRFDPYNDNIQASINPDTGILTIMDLTGKNEIDLTPFVRIAEATVNQVINQKLPLEQIARMHNLDMDVINTTLESALTSAYMKMSKPVNFSLDSREQSNKNKQQPDVEVKIDPDTGGVIIQELRTVVDEIKNPDKEITLADAVKIKGSRNVNIGDVIKLSRNPENFGRIAAQTARQVITQKLRDAERNMLYSTFSEKVGDLVTGTIFKLDSDQIIVKLDDKTDATLGRKEKIPGEKYFPGDVMKFYVLDVKQMTKGPRIVLSRTHPGLLKKLLELEVPEIRQGIVEIKNIVRDAGARAKIAITTLDPNVDPVGACVGNGGERIKRVSSALKGEKIDIIVWNNDPFAFIKSSLAPAQVAKIEPDLTSENAAKVYVYPDQLSLAIGKSGQNVRLAAKLTNWKLDILSIEPDHMPTLKDIFHEVFEDDEQQQQQDL